MFAVILIVITLVLISIYDTISNYEDPTIKKHAKLLVDNNEQFVQIEKSDLYYKDEMTNNYKELIDSNIKQINQKLKDLGKTGEDIYRIVSLHIESNDIMAYSTSTYDLLEINPEFRTYSNPYTYWENEFSIVVWNDLKDFFIEDVTGRLPANDDEIMISNYLADLLLEVGLKPYGEDDYYKPISYEKLVNLNKYFHFGNDKVKIVGIINYDLSEFQSLKNISWDEYNANLEAYNDIFDDLMYKTKNIYNKFFVNGDFINHININDKVTPNAIWRNELIKTGVLVIENTEDGFLKLLNKFRYDNPITIRSSYSEIVDSAIEITDSFPDISLISKIIFYFVTIFVFLSILVINKFVLSKQELGELKNRRLTKNNIKTMILWNTVSIVIISFTLSFISLICFMHIFKIFVIGDNEILNQAVLLGTRQFVILFLSMIGIGMISYIISIISVKIACKSNL